MAVDSNPATGQGNAQPSQSPAAAASTPSQSANAAVAAINNAMKEQQAIGGNTPATTQFTSDAQGVRQQTTPSPVANQTSAQQQVRQAFAAAAQQQQQVAQQQNSGRKPAGDVEMSDASTRQGDKDPMAPLMDRIAALENQLKMSAVAPHVPSVAKYLGMSDSMATEFLMKTDQSYRDSVINAALAASRATASGYSQQQSQVPPMRAPTMQQQTAPAPAAQQQAPRPMQQAPPSRDEMMRANQETLRQAQQTIVGTKRTADQMLEGSSGRAGDEYLRASKGPKIDAGEGHRNYVPDALGSRSALDYQRGQQPTLHEGPLFFPFPD